jgi:hypothetical protein
MLVRCDDLEQRGKCQGVIKSFRGLKARNSVMTAAEIQNVPLEANVMKYNTVLEHKARANTLLEHSCQEFLSFKSFCTSRRRRGAEFKETGQT